MGRGIIKLELLNIKDALMLPEEYKTIGAFCNERGNYISIIVEHADIPEVEESQPFPLVTPIYEAKDRRINEFKEVRIE